MGRSQHAGTCGKNHYYAELLFTLFSWLAPHSHTLFLFRNQPASLVSLGMDTERDTLPDLAMGRPLLSSPMITPVAAVGSCC